MNTKEDILKNVSTFTSHVVLNQPDKVILLMFIIL